MPGSLFVGETNHGWGSVGLKNEGLERLVWNGVTPFEIKTITAQPDGFLLTFTQPVDRATAENPTIYSVAGFTYLYHKPYGSPPINRLGCPVRKVVVAPDGLSVRLAVGCLREGYIHEIKTAGLRSSQNAETILHPTAYYTLNQIPYGDRIIPVDPRDAELCIVAVPASATAPTAKHPTTAPTTWANPEGDRTLLIGTQPGLKFSVAELTAKAGETIQLVFRNTDDMLHNFVLCAPGTGQSIGAAAMALGLDGPAKNYVPDSTDVLYHTALTQPGSSDRILFTAPTTPGDYDYICSFPGHSALMRGTLHMTAL
jgi:azurin